MSGPSESSAWLWHVDLFFRPRHFFRSFAAAPHPLLTAICALLFGMAGAIERTETNFLRGRPVPWVEDWNTYWLAILAFGALGGLFYFVVGGWWYRLRIRWCGAEQPDAALAKRVYLFSAQVYALPALVVTTIENSVFPTPVEGIHSDSWWYAPLLVFPFWSAVVSYLGVRTMFEVRRLHALVWFIVLPSLLYSAAWIGLAVLTMADPVPDLDHPEVYEGETVTFSYPGDWWIDEHEAEGEYESVSLEGMSDAYVEILSYTSQAGVEAELENSLAAVRDMPGYTLGRSFDVWGPYRGAGANASFVEEGVVVHVRIFATERGTRLLESQLYYAEDAEKYVLPVMHLIGRTIEFE
jgi:hypothetical protein